mgnify:CR=1 FL=1
MYAHILFVCENTEIWYGIIFFISMTLKNIRIKDIAKLAGVSVGTVDRVLHNRGRVSEEALKKYHPDTLAIEELFFSGNQKTAMKVSEVRGVIIYLGVRAGTTIINLTPLQVKMAITGFGRASKSQVAAMVGKLIRVPPGPRHDDEYDAMATALTGAAHARQHFIHTQARH